MHTCAHKYWDTNIKYRHRYCKYCRLHQYFYDKKWEDELKIHHFLGRWFQAMDGEGTIEFKYIFEFNCYESWGLALWISFPENAMKPWFFGPECEYFKEWKFHPLAGRKFGPYTNLNNADYNLKKELEKIKENGSKQDSSS